MSARTGPGWGALARDAGAAGILATLVECVFFSPQHVGLPWRSVAVMAVLLSGCFLLVGALAHLVRGKNLVAPIWFLLPVAVGLTTFGLRRPLPALLALVVLLAVLLWRHPSSGYPPVLAALLGSVLGNRLSWFFTFPYDGLATAPSALLTLGVITLASVVLLRASVRWNAQPWRPGVPVGIAVTSLALLAGLLLFDGVPLPRQLGPVVQGPGGPPIVFIVLDTVRADHLSLYGYERDTMPRLAEFASEHGVVADRAVANAPDSLPSHASMFTGLYPSNHGAHRPLPEDDSPPMFAYPLRADAPTAAQILAARGYATAAVTANFGPIGPGLGVERGFDLYRALPDSRCEFAFRSAWWRSVDAAARRVVSRLPESLRCDRRTRRADAITTEALRVIDILGSAPFFLFVNYMDAHDPYDSPQGYAESFAPPGWVPSRLPNPVTEGATKGQHDLTDEDRANLNYRYDGTLAFLDQELDRLLEGLRVRPDWGEMLVVIVGDHGEALGEHDVVGHIYTLYDEMIRVPLVIHSPALLPAPGSRWPRTVQLVDLFALLLGHAGVVPAPGLDAVFPFDRSGPVYAWSFPPADADRFYPLVDRELRSVEFEGWKLIESFDGDLELYDLANDPLELDNLAAVHEERTVELRALLGPRDYFRLTNRADTFVDEAGLERLRALGYIQ